MNYFISTLFLVVGAGFLVLSQQLEGTPPVNNARFFPLMCATLLTVFSTLVLVRDAAARARTSITGSPSVETAPVRMLIPLGVSFGLALMINCIESVGFYPVTCAALLLLLLLGKVRNLLLLLGAPLVWCAAVYLIFERLLAVPLPGPFPGFG